MRARGGLVVALALGVAVLTACGVGGGPAGPATGSPGDSPPSIADLEEQAADVVARHNLPAFAIARVSAGSVTVGVAGSRTYRDEIALSPDASFHLGSNAKAMTAVLVATFIEEGALDLDASLGELFPASGLAPRVSAATLRQVLSHRSGLDDRTLDLRALHAAPDATRARSAAVLDALAAAGDPGQFSYANVNYMLAGVVAEQTGDAHWEALLVDRVFTPLGIRCGFGTPSGEGMPVGHTATGAPIRSDAPVTDNPPAMGPAGTVHCTMGEWATFVAAVLANLRGEDSPVLSASTAADLFAGGEEYVAGWSRQVRGGLTVLTHDGSNTLWYARAVLVVEADEGLLLASNTGERKAVNAMDELTAGFLAARRERRP